MAGAWPAMKIEWVIPCRYVEVRDNIATILGAGGDRFVVTEEPWEIAIMLAIRISALVEELGPDRVYPVENHIRDPRGAVIQEEVGSFSATARGEIATNNWLQGVWVPVEAKFPTETEGTYTITHKFGDSEHLLPVHIAHRRARGDTPAH
ncbi:MAG: hypothetical protein WD827_06455 [Solirubrobacterales bacterium]